MTTMDLLERLEARRPAAPPELLHLIARWLAPAARTQPASAFDLAFNDTAFYVNGIVVYQAMPQAVRELLSVLAEAFNSRPGAGVTAEELADKIGVAEHSVAQVVKRIRAQLQRAFEGLGSPVDPGRILRSRPGYRFNEECVARVTAISDAPEPGSPPLSPEELGQLGSNVVLLDQHRPAPGLPASGSST